MADDPTRPPPAAPAAPSGRLLSLDALRGFDMFWIVGADGIVHALRRISDSGAIDFVSRQLSHKSWAGFAFYDLIFPLFVFIVGVSIVFSVGRIRERAGLAGAVRRILARGMLLYFVGLLYYGGIARGWDQVRLVGVLQRIAICYVAGALLFCVLSRRALVAVCAALLVGYWVLMTFVPIRDVAVDRHTTSEAFAAIGARVSGVFDRGRNLANHVDFQYLPGRRWDGGFDPEGLLSTLPAVATCLLGIFAGLLLQSRALSEMQKVRRLALAGAAAVVLGFLWGLQFPVIKQLWTSSFVLVAGGWSALLLAAFHLIIEVRGHRSWTTPFVWIGVNPIAIYLAHNLVDFDKLAARLVGGPVSAALGSLGPLLVTTVSMAMTFAIVRFMYRRKIFLRL